MTYDLLIGDRSYSSWSLRGWLLFAAFELPVRVHMNEMYCSSFISTLEDWAPARTVPVVRAQDGAQWSDTIATPRQASGLTTRRPVRWRGH